MNPSFKDHDKLTNSMQSSELIQLIQQNISDAMNATKFFDFKEISILFRNEYL